MIASLGPKGKCKRFRIAITSITNVQGNKYLCNTSAYVQLGHVMNIAQNELQQWQLENNSITHQACEI